MCLMDQPRKMQVHEAVLSPERLRQLAAPKQRLFFVAAHAVNELKILEKCIHWSANHASKKKAVEQAQLAMTLFFTGILCGKTKELWLQIERGFFKSRLSQEYEPKLASFAADSLQRLKRCFGGANLMDTVRSSHAFHYSPQAIAETLEDCGSGDLPLWVDEPGNVNTLYLFAEVLAEKALLRETGLSSLDELVQEAASTANDLRTFVEDVMSILMGEVQDSLWEGPVGAADLGDLPRLKEVCIPWFVDSTGQIAEVRSRDDT